MARENQEQLSITFKADDPVFQQFCTICDETPLGTKGGLARLFIQERLVLFNAGFGVGDTETLEDLQHYLVERKVAV